MTRSHYREQSVNRNHTGGIIPHLRVWSLPKKQMELTFRPRRSLLLSPDSSAWKIKARLSTSVTEDLFQKQKSQSVYQSAYKSFGKSSISTFFFPFPHYHTCPHPSECDCAGLDQHQGTLWVCNLTELTTTSSPEIHPLFTGSFSFFLQESWLSHFLSFQSTAHPPSRHVMSRWED